MKTLRPFWDFTAGSVAVVSRGNRYYYAWIALLVLLSLGGLAAWGNQFVNGLITSNMRDQVSWGFYIGNFAFLVGVAAAAVVLVIPAYVYQWGPLKEVVMLAELVSLAAIIMCIFFVTVDLGRPQLFWHLMPALGNPNFPYSLLVWDILVLTSYWAISYFIVTYLLFKDYMGQKYNVNFIMPVIFLSIPLAISIHTVTAFLFMGLKARPFWDTAILAPRFLSSAFSSGPALVLIVLQIMRRVGSISIPNKALFKIAEFLAYAMAINLFFLGVEVFSEFYSPTQHAVHARLHWFGLDGRTDIAIYTWLSLACNVIAFVIFAVRPLRYKLPLLSAGCVLAFGGVFIEKGLGLLLPGMTPDMLGEIYIYNPSLNELAVGVGVWSAGALFFTLMAKVAMAISAGELRHRGT